MARPKTPLRTSTPSTPATGGTTPPARETPATTRGRPTAEATRRLTSERIADDLSAFYEGGGRIEVLEITRPRDASDVHPAPSTPVAPPRQPTRRKTGA